MASDDDSGRGPVTTDTPVGVIGLGAIGDGVASALERAGFPVVVCDVREEATQRHEGAARVASSPAELAGQVDAIVVAVVDDAQVHSVLSGPAGALAAARPGTVVVVVSTITMACVEALGEEAAGYGVVMVDCGVSGGPAAAAAGELVCMVGGDRTVIDAMAPVFDALGSMTVVMGPLRHRPGRQAGPEPGAVRRLAGCLRRPETGRGVRSEPGPPGPGDPGQ